MTAPSPRAAAAHYLSARARWHPLEIAFWCLAFAAIWLLPTKHLILTEIAWLALFALSLDLILGYAGIISLGHAAFFGFGAYAAGLLAKHEIINEPVLALLASGVGDVIMLALGGTAVVFFCCSAYILTSRKDMSFLSGMMMAGFVVLLVAVVANLFLHIPALSLAISVMFILFSSGAILWETSNIIHGGETNYIRATVSLYVSLYNIFVSLLSIFGGMRSD